MLTRRAWLRSCRGSFVNEQLRKYDKLLRLGELAVTIQRTTERGVMEWAIVLGDDFWMEAFSTGKKAREFCELMKWPVRKMVGMTKYQLERWREFLVWAER